MGNLCACDTGEYVSYAIEIERDIATGEGTLNYENGAITVNTTCWFELTNRIPERRYIACSATHMATKKTQKAKKGRVYIFQTNKLLGEVYLSIWGWIPHSLMDA